MKSAINELENLDITDGKYKIIDFRKGNVMVHERVREHIRQMQVKQNWLSKRMQMSEGTLSLILAGKRKMTPDELERLCAVLCVPPDAFVKPEEVKLSA